MFVFVFVFVFVDVKATSGDTQLGGNDFDKKIVDWLAEEFLEKNKVDLRRDRQSLQRLTEAAEKAKQELSGVHSTPISLPFISTGNEGPLHIETTLTRKLYETLCNDLLDKLFEPVNAVIDDSGWSHIYTSYGSHNFSSGYKYRFSW